LRRVPERGCVEDQPHQGSNRETRRVFSNRLVKAQLLRLAFSKYLFSVVEHVALRRVAPRPAAQGLPQTDRCVGAVPPLHVAELSQRDNRYR
jgi:hypothetical protein